jgi:hypothetical protein
LRLAQGKCLHYYFYFVDDELGLCYLRVPTSRPAYTRRRCRRRPRPPSAAGNGEVVAYLTSYESSQSSSGD